MTNSSDYDGLRKLIEEHERRLVQLKAIEAEVAGGRFPDQDQVVRLAVVQEYPDAGDEVRAAIVRERLSSIDYGKLLAEFHAASIFSQALKGAIPPRLGAALIRTFLAGPYAWTSEPPPIIPESFKKAMLDWMNEQLMTHEGP